ncbi:MAG TPA: redoxin domain-containing protein [Gemmataceae bacterium]|nr:redoxin domain-containing protein [Gemmataceae bacterium]
MQWICLSLLLSALSPHADSAQAATKVARIDNFQLRDPRGQLHQLSDWRDRKLVVVVFLGVECPLARLYGPRLTELADEFAPQGVAFVAINSNQNEGLTELERYARLHRLPFPFLKDVGNVVADQFDAQRSPEVFVLDERRIVRYRGRIDDQYGVGVQRPQPARRDLAIALSELLAGRPVSQPVCAAGGCCISRASQPAQQGPATYCRDIAPILQQHCQTCHRAGQIAPFTLTSYKDAAGWAATIREVVAERRMPPWHADPRHGRFANDPSLSEREKQLLFAWIDGDCPRGDPADLPPPPAFAPDWTIAAPDLVVSMTEPFTVPAQGTIEYQYFVVDPGFREDRWIQAAEIRPGNRAVVHHCNVFLQPPGSDDIGLPGVLGSYCLAAAASGTPPLVLPPGMAKRVPAGWRFVFVVHYNTIGSEQTDRTSLGLKFADPRSVKKEVATKLMYDPDLCIPPRAAEHAVAQTWQVNRNVLLLAFFPHMHLRGKSFCYEAIYADGTSEILLDVPRYDFNWQNRYELAEPKYLPAGSRLRCSAIYDNSAENPANPDPAVEVRTGTQSWEEMFNGYFDLVLADEDLTRPIPWNMRLAQGMRAFFRPGVAGLLFIIGGLYLSRRRLASLVTRS